MFLQLLHLLNRTLLIINPFQSIRKSLPPFTGIFPFQRRLHPLHNLLHKPHIGKHPLRHRQYRQHLYPNSTFSPLRWSKPQPALPCCTPQNPHHSVFLCKSLVVNSVVFSLHMPPCLRCRDLRCRQR
uniref:Uncharacterized protein n=1 Tax=Cucumis sativus TaxID=3659 RepID=A0A0A0KSS0_CUCSA